MSRPQNPLNFYRSYSYHHILYVCDTTDTSDALADADSLEIFDHPFDINSRYNIKTLESGEGKYIVLINGLTDANMFIESAKWTTIMNPNASDGSSRFGIIETEGEIVINEPLGAKFFNIIAESVSLLEHDPSSLIFSLKTIFVGHTNEGTTTIISNIKPYTFVIYDIAADFDEAGGKYVLAVQGVSHGVTKNKKYSSISDGLSINIQKNSTLKQAVNQLQNNLNQEYGKLKTRLQRNSECHGIELNFDNFQDVTYHIKLDKYYENEIYIVGDLNKPETTNSNSNDIILTSRGSLSSIETLINDLMMSSSKVIGEIQGNAETGERISFSITSTLKTTKDTHEVHYVINPKRLIITKKENDFNYQDDVLFSDDEYKSKLGIEFDYIFTGANVDIINLGIKMDMGLSFFQALVLQKSSINTGSNLNTYTQSSPSFITSGSANSILKKDDNIKTPLFLGSSIRDPNIRNKNTPIAGNYNALLSRYAAYEGIGISMTITGNPQILADTTQTTSALISEERIKPDVIPSEEQSSDEEEQSRNIFPEIHRIPGFVKINMRMPENITTTDFNTESFWYQGWYYLYSIHNIFAGGEFKQELELISLPPDINEESRMGAEDVSDCEKQKVEKEEQEQQSNQKNDEEQTNGIIDRNKQKQKILNEEKEAENQQSATELPSSRIWESLRNNNVSGRHGRNKAR